MDKKPYYVSVQAKTILENQGDAAYEFEINASDEDIDQLSTLFDKMGSFDQGSYIKAHALAYPYHLDSENDGHDYYLREVYQLLYQLGTAETRQHIENTGLLDLEENNG